MYRLCLALLCLCAASPPSRADCPCGPACSQACPKACDCLEKACQQATAQNKALLIFVRQPAQVVEGCVSVRVEVYPGQQHLPGVIMALPDGKGGLIEVARRDSYPTVEWLKIRVQELRSQWCRPADLCGGIGYFGPRVRLGIWWRRPHRGCTSPGPCQ